MAHSRPEYPRYYPRLLHFGIPWGDITDLACSEDWIHWGKSLLERGNHYGALGKLAIEAGRETTGAELLRTAAACMHYAQFQWPHSPAKWGAQAQSRRAYATAAGRVPLMSKRVEIPFGAFALPGYRRSAVVGAPCVVLLNGLDSAKEVELDRFADGFFLRGLSTLCVDVPGIGELGSNSLDDFDDAINAIIRFLRRESGSSVRIGVFGVSFGGYLACRAAAVSDVDASVCLGGFHDSGPLRRLPPVGEANLRRAYQLSRNAPWGEIDRRVDLSNLHGRVSAPLLVVHGTQDHLVDAEQVDRLRSLGRGVTVRVVETGEHVCTNRFTECLPEIWDFMVEQLRAEALK